MCVIKFKFLQYHVIEQFLCDQYITSAVHVRYYHSHLSCDNCFNEKNVGKWKMPALLHALFSLYTFFISFVSITRSKFKQEERKGRKFVRIIKENKFLWIIKNLCVRFTDYLWMWGEHVSSIFSCEKNFENNGKCGGGQNVKWQKRRNENLFNGKRCTKFLIASNHAYSDKLLMGRKNMNECAMRKVHKEH